MNYDDFLIPRLTPTKLDIFFIRTSILKSLQEVLPYLSGTLLDIGCGHQPYKSLLLNPPSCVTQYLGLDLEVSPIYKKQPDIFWDGHHIPLKDATVDSAIATEVFEHCPYPEMVMQETLRVLKPGGILFFTVPFLWPLHDTPYDEYRYTPFALERHLTNAGFERINLKALGGWDASLAQMIGLWSRRRFRIYPRKQAIFSYLAFPLVFILLKIDKAPENFTESSMITGLSGTAFKP